MNACKFVYLRCQRDGPARERHTRPCGRLVAHIMNACTFYNNDGSKYVRISKSMARNFHIMGYDIIVAPCNACLFTQWRVEGTMTASDDFDKYVDSYTYYNCNNKMGRYVSYYVKK